MCVYVFLGYFLHKYNVLAKKAGPRGAVFFRLTKELVWADRPELIFQGGQTRVDIVVP